MGAGAVAVVPPVVAFALRAFTGSLALALVGALVDFLVAVVVLAVRPLVSATVVFFVVAVAVLLVFAGFAGALGAEPACFLGGIAALCICVKSEFLFPRLRAMKITVCETTDASGINKRLERPKKRQKFKDQRSEEDKEKGVRR